MHAMQNLWPPHTHKLKLGSVLLRIRRGKSFSGECYRRIMDSIGVPMETFRERNFDQLIAALKTHFDLFGDYDIPRYFVVPSDETWPKESWGMALGTRMARIKYRSDELQASYRKRLYDMGIYP